MALYTVHEYFTNGCSIYISKSNYCSNADIKLEAFYTCTALSIATKSSLTFTTIRTRSISTDSSVMASMRP